MEEGSRVQQDIRTLDTERVEILRIVQRVHRLITGASNAEEQKALLEVLFSALQLAVETLAAMTQDEQLKKALTRFIVLEIIDAEAVTQLRSLMRQAAVERRDGRAVIGSLTTLSLCTVLQSCTGFPAQLNWLLSDSVSVLIIQSPAQFEVHIGKGRLIGLLDDYARIPHTKLEAIHVQAAAISKFWSFELPAHVKSVLEGFWSGDKKHPRKVKRCMEALFNMANNDMVRTQRSTATQDACHDTLANDVIFALTSNYVTNEYKALATKRHK